MGKRPEGRPSSGKKIILLEKGRMLCLITQLCRVGFRCGAQLSNAHILIQMISSPFRIIKWLFIYQHNKTFRIYISKCIDQNAQSFLFDNSISLHKIPPFYKQIQQD